MAKLVQNLFAVFIICCTINVGSLGAQCGIPTGLAASTAGGNAMKLSWTAVAGASGYKLQIEDANNSGAYNIEFPVSGTPFTAGLPYSGNFKFKVRAVCGGSQSDWSAFSNFTTGGSTGGGGTVGGGGTTTSCGIPTGLAASTAGGNAMKLSWTAVAGASGYKLQIEDANNSGAYNIEFPVSGTPFTAGLPYSGNFKFKVRAVCGGSQSDWSAFNNFTTGGSTGGGGTVGGGGTTTSCGIPSGLAASTAGGNAMKLSWTAVAGASGYKLQIEDANNSGAYNIEFPVSGTPFTAGLPYSGNFKFKVRAVCSGSQSDWSAFSNFTTGGSTGGGGTVVGGGTTTSCGIPSGLAASTAGGNAMTLSWTAVAGASGYKLQIEDANNSGAYNIEFPVSGTPFTAGLPYSGNFKFKVRAVCGGSQSDWSAFSNFTTGGSTGGGGTVGGGGTTTSCGIPSGVIGTGIGGNAAKLQWAAVSGATGYEIQIENAQNSALFKVEFPVSSNIFTAGLPSSGSYKFKVRAICNGTKSAYSAYTNFSANISGTDDRLNGLEVGSNSQFLVYPNPASDFAEIDLLQWMGKTVQIHITDRFGRMVYQKNLEVETPTITVEVQNWVSGQYFIAIQGEGSRMVSKRISVINPD